MKKSRFSYKKSVILCLSLFLVLCIGIGLSKNGDFFSFASNNSKEIRLSASADTEQVTYIKKVDGDTAYFANADGVEMKCRFLAIDTPESVKHDEEVEPYAIEASEYTHKRLASADKIVLEFDENSDLTDKYGRVLAWVWVDGSLLQKELVEQGYAEVKYLYDDYAYVDALKKEQAKAKEMKKGIWSNN